MRQSNARTRGLLVFGILGTVNSLLREIAAKNLALRDRSASLRATELDAPCLLDNPDAAAPATAPAPAAAARLQKL